jgi:hypothetical protein
MVLSLLLFSAAPGCSGEAESESETRACSSAAPSVDENTGLATPSGGASVPITSLVLVDDATRKLVLSANVRSEDQGRELHSRAFINYGAEPPMDFAGFGGGDTLAPATCDEVRTVHATLDLSELGNGCYQVALVVTHEFDSATAIPANTDDVAMLVWWMVKGDPATIDFGECPGVPPSAP